MKLEAVFLDRDGVLNPHIPGDYLKSADDLVLLPGVAQAVRRLNDAGLLVIVISNQQGVGKDVMTLADLHAIERRMGEMLIQEARAHLDRVYYCTDLAHVQSPRRKPEPGMLLEAAQEFGLTLANTVFLGDSPTDIQAGHAAGVGGTILLLSGGTRPEQVSAIQPPPDFIFDDLPEAVDWILQAGTIGE
jgi:D-glycero-D-manno-heptose 1,7-bisphosphate phosphatase